jgi:sugar (pentulose or hexulose) kinase
MSQFVAKWMGIDITTTEMALAVADRQGSEGFASLKMRGATHWNGDPAYPAFDLGFVSGMFADLLGDLQHQGWRFDQGGSLSVACRQHDMVVLDRNGNPLLPALSWQCNAAHRETQEMNEIASTVAAVGRVEERFILPKLRHVLKQDASLEDRIGQVMTTGDWTLGVLCDQFRLSTSDALSNGLLEQASRELASEVLLQAQLSPEWIPAAIQSGHNVGEVQDTPGKPDGLWRQVCQALRGWQVVAGLGDNHASALGCGMRDERTLVVSAGTSGTINLACAADAKLNPVDDPAARFEFYRNHSLLLRMLAFCGDWYNRFLDEFAGDFADAHRLLNELGEQADQAKVLRIECDRGGERYRPGWTRLTLGQKVASVQISIATELLLHVHRVLFEVPGSTERIERYVLTGGLSQSLLFQRVFHAGIQLMAPGKEVGVSGRTGPLRYKTSAYGALLNARLPEWQQDLANMPGNCFPMADCARAEDIVASQLQRLLASELNGL